MVKAAAFWAGLATLRDAWGMDKADLRTFMSDGVAAALSDDAAKAVAFWAGLATLRPHFREGCGPAQFVCGGIASRLANGRAEPIVDVVRRLGIDRAKTVLKKGPLLTVVAELVAYMDTVESATLDADLSTGRSRKALAEGLKARKRRRLEINPPY